ncbi:MAG: hypothetical protein QOH06_3434 [Acidobacteriota bacterium]|nr:hypothetical protein [Acidobacteriota bacterium]
MRDDFSVAVKDLLAKRVAFQCSRPGCGQVTSGPQADPTKHINVGVAAHITAASPEGPRFDRALTPEERSSPYNGVWLCQTCAKLVDNDPVRYPADMLREWKRFAEDRATQALEGRSVVNYGAVAAFRRIERLLPELLAEMRRDLVAHPLRRECALLKKAWSYASAGAEFVYYFEDHPELDSQFKILENYGLVIDVTTRNVTRYRISEDLAEYLGVV